jgi:hypothetical protein
VKAGIAPGLRDFRPERRAYFVFAPVEPDAPLEDEPEGELLGAEDEPDDELLGDEDAPEDEDPLGEAEGLPAAPLSAALPACTPSLDAVSLSRRPVAFNPSFCWYSRSACRVFGPILPSTSPGS